MNMGFTMKQALGLRNLTTRTFGHKTKGRCSYTMIWMQLGRYKDPYYLARREELEEWLHAWDKLTHNELFAVARLWRPCRTLASRSHAPAQMYGAPL